MNPYTSDYIGRHSLTPPDPPDVAFKIRCANCPHATIYRVSQSGVYACKLCLTDSEEQRLKTIGKTYP